ncbi:MAG: sigma-54 dependent transcriptional regulator [Paramuribaculum sp.]|nr:sigma-54 dependent transcriptional regulator [Paramuribaculum sp.]
MQINLSSDLSPETQQAKMRFGIVGNAPALIAAINRAIQVAPIDLSVLVTGESGTGKEFFPKIIHAYSPRKHSRYIAVNCGAIPEGTIDSELFGHEKGSFTGAVAARKGYFEEADGGTIFLDEVAELPLTTQARLLRVLETGEFLKVGSSTVQKTNIRIVAATNVNLLEAIARGQFREDLYYRLSTVQIHVPALRDRGNDILLLSRKFASDFSERYTMPPVTFDDAARSAMLHYRWPGNVRQLKNIVEQVALFDAGKTITAADMLPYLPEATMSYTPATARTSHSYESERELLFNMIFRLQAEIDLLKKNAAEQTASHTTLKCIPADTIEHPISTSLVKYTPEPMELMADTRKTHEVTLEDTEREAIRKALEDNGGKRKAAARQLKISERTLYRKIKEYGLE